MPMNEMDVKQAKRMISAELRKHKFRGSNTVYSLPLSEGVSGFLGVTCTGRRGEPISVWIVVGVRHEAIHGRGVSLGAYPASDTNPTLVVPMRNLGAGDRIGEYQLTGSQDSDQAELRQIVHDVSKYATAFYSRFATIGGAMEAIATQEVKGLLNSECFVPVALLELGESREAVAHARAALAKMDARRGTGEQYAIFVERLVGVATQ
jgi:hypothetical protein